MSDKKELTIEEKTIKVEIVSLIWKQENNIHYGLTPTYCHSGYMISPRNEGKCILYLPRWTKSQIECNSIEEAKSKSQAHFESEIRKCIK